MLPTVYIISEYRQVVLFLIKELLSQKCEVVVLTRDPAEWKINTVQFKDSGLSIRDIDRGVKDEIKYMFVFDEFLYAKKIIEGKKVKHLFVKELTAKDTKDLPESVVCLGEVFSESLDSKSNGPLHKILRSVIFDSKAKIPEENKNLYIIYGPDAASELTRQIFSYGLSGKKILIAEKTSVYTVLGVIEKALPQTIFIKVGSVEEVDVSLYSLHTPKSISKNALSESVIKMWNNKGSYIEKKVEKRQDQASFKAPDSKKNKPYKLNLPTPQRAVVASIIGLVLVLVLPFFCLLLSFGLLRLSVNAAKDGNFSTVNSLVTVSNKTASLASSLFWNFTKLPVVGPKANYFYEISQLTQGAGKIIIDTIPVLSDLSDISVGVLGEGDHDLIGLSERASINMEALYQNLSFFESDLSKKPGLEKIILSQAGEVGQVRKKLLEGSRIVRKLPILLGVDTPKTYLVLQQNNMELRPTGGFIGSFNLSTFQGGRLIDTEFLDVYTADGQLQGHVEPPLPIKNYLGEANWYLRDSNWDPNFLVSAQRAEWFLEKELERGVDGVIGVDVDVARSLLTVLGSIRLADFGTQIDANNLYEKVQYEVESSFFPGSQKKANLLTSLGRAILERLKSADKEEKAQIAETLARALDEKHIQIAMHDSQVQNAFENLGWSGALNTDIVCSINCVNFPLAVVESNVGVNKANYFIDRSLSAIFVAGAKVQKAELTINYRNNAALALGLSGKYKNYIRLFGNEKLEFVDAKVTSIEGTKEVDLEIETKNGVKSAGALIEVNPGQKVSIKYTVTLNAPLRFGENGTFQVYLRKQAGTDKDPLVVRVVMPEGVAFSGKTNYNTILAEDFSERITW